MALFNRHKSKSDEALMKWFQEGSESAFDEIYRRYSTRLLHFMYRMLNHNEALAQDLLHDVFMKLVERPERFDTSKNFKSWIFTVTANECRKQFRKADEDEVSENAEVSSALCVNQMNEIDNQTFRRSLRKELLTLSYEHRCTFILRFQEGLSVKEVSEIMGCSEGTVKSRSHHCVKNLSHKLAEFNPINY